MLAALSSSRFKVTKSKAPKTPFVRSREPGYQISEKEWDADCYSAYGNWR